MKTKLYSTAHDVGFGGFDGHTVSNLRNGHVRTAMLRVYRIPATVHIASVGENGREHTGHIAVKADPVVLRALADALYGVAATIEGSKAK